MTGFYTLRFDPAIPALSILDQTLLPGREEYIYLTDSEAVREAIGALRVRGAPAIGVSAAYGLCLGAYALMQDGGLTVAALRERAEHLGSVRPTAVNLGWALRRMMACADALGESTPESLYQALLREAQAIENEDRAACRAIGEHGLTLLRPGMGVLTHCNAGALAATDHGTALAPLYYANTLGYGLKIYADETRPLLQGARLTAWELSRSGADVTVICDNMAASLMKQGLIGAVFTGCDRVAANGDAANKIGTLSVAIAAKHFGIPMYICAPYSTIDPHCPTGDDIHIEERDSREVSHMWYRQPMTPDGVTIRNPAFDVTDAGLITAFVTEQGLIYPPYDFAGKTL